MDIQTLEAIAQELNAAGVRYLVAGGLAVAAHGYLRFTADLDVVIALEPTNVLNAFAALARLGYRPLVPITAEQFADPEQRKRWIDEKGMQVLNLHSERFRTTPIDLFVTEPFDFSGEFAIAMEAEIAPGLALRFVSIDTLITMKEQAGRLKDLDDIEHLRILRDERYRS